MSEASCFDCKKSIDKDEKIECSDSECQNQFHRKCVDIDDALYESMQKNPQIAFICPECRNSPSNKVLAKKLATLEDTLNKLVHTVNQMQGRMNQHLYQYGGLFMCNGLDNKKSNSAANNLVVMGNNSNSDRLQVVWDYGRWVQVGKFAPSTTEEDIIDHVAEELEINKNLVKCTKLVKNDADLAQLSYCKFKISIPDFRFNELFNEAIWPSGVMVSPFTPRSQMNQNHRI